jgi:hypothetical protein
VSRFAAYTSTYPSPRIGREKAMKKSDAAPS